MQIATIDGGKCDFVLYRHTFMGETKFARKGEELPELSSRPGIWEAYTADNEAMGEGFMKMLVGKGLIHATIMIHIPEVGDLINLKYGKYNMPDGLYKITEAECGNEYFHIFIKRVGDIDPSKLIHVLGLWSC